jgi:ribonuclease Z
MTTTVTLTGTGVPFPDARRAGAGVLVRHEKTVLQFDAGRGTTMRLAEEGVLPHALTAVFLTHVHSDHVVDLPDLAMTRWVQRVQFPAGPLSVVAPAGGAAEFARRMLEPYAADIAVRTEHVNETPAEVDLTAFPMSGSPEVIWRSPDGTVTVRAVAVRHEPVQGAVAYRVDTPDGAVVISGDTRVCAEVEGLARGADILVHEACRTTALAELIRGTHFEKIFDYHADTVALGALAERASVPHTVLTHLIPPPGHRSGGGRIRTGPPRRRLHGQSHRGARPAQLPDAGTPRPGVIPRSAASRARQGAGSGRRLSSGGAGASAPACDRPTFPAPLWCSTSRSHFAHRLRPGRWRHLPCCAGS